MTLETALNKVAHRVGLDWHLKDRKIHIMTGREAEDRLSIRIYDLSDLLDEDREPGLTANGIRERMMEAVFPNSWVDLGGPGAAELFGNLLVVSQTNLGHHQVARWLSRLGK